MSRLTKFHGHASSVFFPTTPFTSFRASAVGYGVTSPRDSQQRISNEIGQNQDSTRLRLWGSVDCATVGT